MPFDVVLIEGRTRVGQVVKMVSLSPWSHAAIYIGRLRDIKDEDIRKLIRTCYQGNEDDQLLIETELGAGTTVNNLDVYAGDNLRICRPRGLEDGDKYKMLKFLLGRLGDEYGIRHSIDFLRFFFPYGLLPKSWRSSIFNYAPGDVAKVVCSTLIAESFYVVDYPVLPLIKLNKEYSFQLFQMNPMLCKPCDFDYSPYFTILKFPFYDFKSTCHELPWKGKKTLKGKEQKHYIHDRDIKALKNVSKN